MGRAREISVDHSFWSHAGYSPRYFDRMAIGFGSYGASRAAIQRNLALMEEQGLIREVTGQDRFRVWKITV